MIYLPSCAANMSSNTNATTAQVGKSLGTPTAVELGGGEPLPLSGLGHMALDMCMCVFLRV